MEFNTVSISDGITMGTEGMRASLVSREVIADSIELVARGNLFDGLVVLVGEMAEVEVAGPDFNPGVGDADDGAAQLVVVEADRLEHGAGGRAAGAVGDGAAMALEVAVGWRCVLQISSLKVEGHHRCWMMAGGFKLSWPVIPRLRSPQGGAQ